MYSVGKTRSTAFVFILACKAEVCEIFIILSVLMNILASGMNDFYSLNFCVGTTRLTYSCYTNCFVQKIPVEVFSSVEDI
jgi:hypothetical protein